MKKFIPTILLAIFALSCGGGSVPKQGSADYEGAVKSFYAGLAALEAGDDQRAITELSKTKELAPTEPAARNNLGVLYLRQRDLEKSTENLEEAAELAPKSAAAQANLAALAEAKGETDKVLEHLRKAVELDPKDYVSLFSIAEETEKQGKDAEAIGILTDQLKKELPDNLALNVEIARLAAKTGDAATLKSTVESLDKRSDTWTPEIKEQLAKLTKLATSDNLSSAAQQTAFFKNVLLRDPGYRSSLAEIKASDTAPGRLIRKPLVLPAPDFKSAPADTAITFEKKIVADVEAKTAFVIFKDGEKPIVAYSTAEKTVIGDVEIPVSVSSPKQVAQLDFDYDFRIDLAFATAKGFRLFRQKEDGTYEDVTASTGLPTEITVRPYNGAWPFDYDSEGDLDIVLAPSDGVPFVLRNVAEGKFSKDEAFDVPFNTLDLAIGDLDEDGDSDISFRTAKGISLFLNQRGGKFEEKVGLTTISPQDGKGPLVGSVSFANLHQDNGPQIIAVIGEVIDGFSINTSSGESRSNILFQGSIVEGSDTILTADVDNNGGLDLIVGNKSGTWSLLLETATETSPGRANFSSISSSQGQQELRPEGLADLDGDGILELVGLDKSGKPSILKPQLTKNYHWQIVRPKAAKTEGDQRINSYGIGGEMELRSGLLAQKRVITSPQVHFGLGENTSADVLRVIWQNGYVQAEFDLKSDQVIAAEQRLKGSCPHLFAWDGGKFEHVKDAPPWSPALGLKINAQDTYGILQTEEWFKIPGEALKPKDGKYELRITGEYWESFYIDSYKLLAVDHPEGTEVFTDERFSIPLPPLEVFTTGKVRPFTSAIDHNGKDVTGMIAEIDEGYLDGIKRGKYQGVAEDHWVELRLPVEAPADGKLWLVGDGWMHPTDASINVQRGQATDRPPKSLSIEIPDGEGEWKTVKDNLGFPAGKMKTVLLDLTGIFPKGMKDRRIRLRTELEIFWDRLGWAEGVDDEETKITTIDPSAAGLSYRGFSVIDKRNDSSPEIPDYSKILTTGQRWRDLEGYYTRFGDVLELLANTDDRNVLANAGDELSLSFPALADPPKGWERDFVIIGNGWIKDGDLNSVFSKTLLPLPTHSTNDYSRAPTVLEEDPVYKKHKADWVKYHTRYVAPDAFRNAFRGR
jgi:tetratricopeptide (TPR) repeat protein